jgi:hypothetical protein
MSTPYEIEASKLFADDLKKKLNCSSVKIPCLTSREKPRDRIVHEYGVSDYRGIVDL